MPAHYWDTENDFRYCTLTDCDFISGSVQISGSSGVLLSDIRDSTIRAERYTSFEISDNIPTGTDIQYFWRSGLSGTYDERFWTDWIPIDRNALLTEHTVSIFDDRISTEFPPETLIFVGLERMWRTGIEFFSSCRIGYAIVGVSQLGSVGSETNIIGYCTPVENIITIRGGRELDSDRENVTVQYKPIHPVIGNGRRYVQIRADMTSSVSGSYPSIESLKLNFRLNVFNTVMNEFPLMYRRL